MFLVTQLINNRQDYERNEVQVLCQLAQSVAEQLQVPVQGLKSDLLASEAYQASTIGGQAVLPKICTTAVQQPTIFAYTFTQPVPWRSGQTWHLVTSAIILATPDTQQATSVLDVFRQAFSHEEFTKRPINSGLNTTNLQFG
ncbi:PTS sugar transporter subunit IIA [Agrilactobacillus yilanensis]|uniref:PTS sugar transporter subunit IIA n=1 Tax=Agrilactobacillus yilanensis TaxID=2485997 RepID=A0ABW4J5C0_9LACO|nr:PTS sugar transporter subunit IIA [Agrilactobacillus yilanensis]